MSADLSTPQKILHDTSKLLLPPSPPDEEGARARQQLDRHQSSTPDDDGDVEMVTPPASIVAAGGAARRKKKRTDDDDEEYRPESEEEEEEGEEEEEERERAMHLEERRVLRRTPRKKGESERDRKKREKEEIRSRFTEGSMRDRASEPPPREIIGDTVGGSSDDDDEEEPPAAPEKEKEKKRRFTFGLGSLFRFNPFSIVDEARAAYVRQKALHEARERKKEEMKRQKKEAEELYFEMKARGDFKGTLLVNDLDGVVEGTDEDSVAGFAEAGAAIMMGSARKRKRSEFGSIGSDGAIREQLEQDGDSEGEGEEDELDDGEAMEEDYDAEEPEEGEEPVLGIRYEDTIAPSASPANPTDKKSIRNIGKKTAKALTGAQASNTPSSSTVNGASSTPSTTNSVPAKPLTKRELQKQERLRKKVSTLEEQLEKVRRELEETRRSRIPPAPDASRQMMPPPPPPHPTPVARINKNSEMLPPPVPRSTKGASATDRSKLAPPETPAQKSAPTKHRNQMLPDTPEPTPAGDRHVAGAMSPSDEDTSMDEGFSMIAISPVVLNPSSVAESSPPRSPQPQPEALVISKVRKNAGRRSISPGLSGLRKMSGAGVRKVSNAISNAMSGGSGEDNVAGKPERKKRRGPDGPPVGSEDVPPILNSPTNGAAH